ncbi:MAG: hypothetical protein ACYT04_56415 [Nostoc sp.]
MRSLLFLEENPSVGVARRRHRTLSKLKMGRQSDAGKRYCAARHKDRQLLKD